MKTKEFNQNESKKHDEIQLWCYNNAKKIIVATSKKGIAENDIKELSVQIEDPIVTTSQYGNNKNIVGYLDLVMLFGVNGKYFKINVEVKPYIYSLGDLIRQIKTYKTYRNGIFLVASPDDRFKDVLKTQDISFFKTPEL